MRIISQNGKWDYPYDMVIIKRYENMFFADTNLVVNAGSSVEMATYSTPEKADKAMEMLHEKLLSYMQLQGGMMKKSR